jgi:hypothetical protein
MPKRVGLGIRILMLQILSIFSCVILFYNNDAYSQLNENALESVANETGVDNNAQINVGRNPLHFTEWRICLFQMLYT